MKYRIYAIYSLFILISANSFAQDSFYFIAQLKDYQSQSPISAAHIINLKNKKGSISNLKGYFLIHVSNKDYLKISYLGYNNLYIQVKQGESKDTLIFYLHKKTFKLDEVDVYPWSKDEFKYEFIHKQFKTDSIDLLLQKIRVPKSELLAIHNNKGFIAIPIFANYKTKKERQIIQLEQLKRWTLKENAYRKLITNITGYQKAELNAFINYCNFSKRYISYAREYYLALAIKKKYIEFEKVKLKSAKKY